MRASERYVNFYDLVVKVRAKHAPVPPIMPLIELWRKHGQEGGLVHEREKGLLRYRIGGMEVDEAQGLAVMLIRRADQNAPHATFSNLQTGKLRVAKKEAHEGGDTAAHVVLSLLPREPNIYLCLVESVSGLSHRIVTGLLNDLIRQACKEQGKENGAHRKPTLFAYKDPAGGKKETPYQPQVELQGYLSDDLKRDLDEGTLRQVELIRSAAQKPLGGDQYLIEEEHRLLIKADKRIPPNNRLARLKRAWSGKMKEFRKARIAFKDRNDRSHTVDVSLDRGAPEQQLYVRSVKFAAINPPLISRVKPSNVSSRAEWSACYCRNATVPNERASIPAGALLRVPANPACSAALDFMAASAHADGGGRIRVRNAPCQTQLIR